MTQREAIEIVRPVHDTGEGLREDESMYGFIFDDDVFITRVPFMAKSPCKLREYKNVKIIVGPKSNAATVVSK